MLLAAALAAVPPSSAVHAEATASVRIERPVSVRAVDWDRLARSKRSERIVRDERGQLVLLRLVECE
jgi:hypothetical protein